MALNRKTTSARKMKQESRMDLRGMRTGLKRKRKEAIKRNKEMRKRFMKGK